LRKSKITHGPRRRTNVERIAHVHEDNAQTGEFGGNGQAVAILRQTYGSHQPSFLRYKKPLSIRPVASLLPQSLFTPVCNCKNFVKPLLLPTIEQKSL